MIAKMLNQKWGYDKGQARAYSTLVGASEAGLQYLLGGISSLGGKVSGNALSKMLNGVDKAFARTAIKLGGNMLSEGIEEGLQEVLTPWFKNLTLHTNEDINWSEVAYSSLLGALTAGFMEGPSTISGELNTYKTGKTLQAAGISAKRLANLGKTFSADTVAYQLAGRVDGNTGAYTLGRLFNEIGATLSGQNMTEITNALVAKGMDKETARKNAEVLAYVVEGGQLTKGQVAVIEANDVLAEVVRTTLIDANTTWNQRTKAYNETLNDLAQKLESGKQTANTAAAQQTQAQAENTATVDNVTTTEKTAPEGGYEVSAEGQTVFKESGDAVSIKQVADIRDGKVMLELEDGSTVDAQDVAYSSGGEAMVYEMVADIGISADDANVLLDGYRSAEISADTFVKGTKDAFRYGVQGYSASDLASGRNTSKLNADLRGKAYEMGRKFTGKQATEKPANTARRKGTVKGYNVTSHELNKAFKSTQRQAYKVLSTLAEVTGIDIVLYKSTPGEDGTFRGGIVDGIDMSRSQGAFSWHNDKVYIDINSGLMNETEAEDVAKYAMLRTFAHEFTHFIEKYNPVEYENFRELVFDTMRRSGTDPEYLIDAYMEQNPDVDREQASREVVAEAMTDILPQSTFVRELAQKHKSIFEKLHEKLKAFVKELREYFASIGSNQAPEARAVKENIDGALRYTEEIVKTFDRIAVQAVERYQEGVPAQKNTAIKGGVQYSTMAQKVQANNTIAATMSDSERTRILSSKQLVAPIYKGQADLLIEEEKPNLESSQDKLVKSALVRIGEEFDVFTDYDIEDVDVKITLSRGNLRESISKKATPSQIAKLLPILKNAVEKSVGIESHKNRYFYDNTTISFDNLLGGYIDGEYFVPVRFGLKHIRGGEVTLYVVIDQQKIKAEVLKPITQTNRSTGSRSAYVINIAQIVPFVNSKDLLRYLPDDMLTSNQRVVKWESIAETIIYTNDKNDKKYKKFVDAGNMQAAKMMVDAAAKASGYTIKAYHGTTNRQEKNRWNPNTRTWDTEYKRITVFKRQYPEQVGHFFNSDIGNAGGYGNDLYSVYLMLRKPLVIDCKGQNYASITHDGMEMDTYEWAAYAKKHRYDGVIFENISDGVGYGDLSILTTDYVVFDSNRIKSADIISYDDEDNIIPISKRFDVSQRDIRYQRRTSTLTNRDILAQASEIVDKQSLTDGQRYALQVFDRRLQELKDMEAQKREQYSILKMQRANGTFESEIRKTQNRIQTLNSMINRKSQELLSIEDKTVLKRVLEKARTVIEEKQAAENRKAMDSYRQRTIEGREKTAMRHKIQKVVKELNDLLIKPTRDKHIIPALQKPVAEMLEILNMDTVNAAERIARLDELIAKETDPEVLQSLRERRERIATMGENMGKRLADLKAEYSKIANSDDRDIAGVYLPEVAERIEYLGELVGDTPLIKMTLEQMDYVLESYQMILHRVKEANKGFYMARNKSVKETAQTVGSELKQAGEQKDLHLKGMEAVLKFDWNNLKPVWAFERIGSKTLTDLFDNVRAGEDTWAEDVTEAREFYLEQAKKYGYQDWDHTKRYKFQSASGAEFELTIDQIMSLYAYSKREQAMEHLRLGGIVFDENTDVIIKKMGIPLKFNPTKATAYNLPVDTLAEIVDTLTEEQKAFVDAMQEYLSTTMGAKGNEISLAMYGIKLFKEKYYFPLKSARQYLLEEQNKQKGDVKIKNKGFTKETVKKANNPVVLAPFMDVWAGHVDEMSMYHAFVLPMEDFYRVYNYKTGVSENAQEESIKGLIQNAHTKAATNYIEQLLKDLNGGAVTDPRESTSKALMAKFKKASVFASMSVVVQQPSAVGRAFALIDPKYFIGRRVDAKRHKLLWAELKKYAPVAVIKEMGYFDTNMGRSAKDFIAAQEYGSLKEKAKAIVKDSGFRDEVLSWFPAMADEMTWCWIWEAVKREMHAKHPSLDVHSDAFLQAAGQRFTEVITKTQVYDSVLSRSANMRSKGGLMNMLTAFAAEPTTAINMIEDAVVQLRKGNKAYAKRTLASVFTSVFLNSLLVSLVYAMRDDDEDETFVEKYLSSFAAEMVDGVNPITYYPVLRDVWSVLQGYDIERTDMALVTDMVDSLKRIVQLSEKDTSTMSDEALDQHEKKLRNAWLSLMDTVFSFTGLPVKNIRRDYEAGVNLVKTIRGDRGGRSTTWNSLIDNLSASVKETVPVWGWKADDSKADKLYRAITKGDAAYRERLMASYGSDTALHSAIRTGLRNNDPRIREAAIAWNSGENATYMRIAKEILKEKHFVQDDVVLAIRAEADALKKDSSSSTSATSNELRSFFTMDTYLDAVMDNDREDADIIKTDMIQTAVANGDSQEEAEKDFSSSFVTKCGKAYQDGELTSREAVTLLEKYGDLDREEADEKVQYWVFKEEYPAYDDMSQSAVTKYYDIAEPAGIGIETYYSFLTEASKCTGEQDADGKTISGSVKAEKLELIDALPLTRKQKDALYLAEGWAESKLYEAPWH